jgi:RNA polymerase sigma factor (sigma-70 family)
MDRTERYYEYINELVAKVKAGDTECLPEIASYYEPLLKACIRRTIAREPKLAQYREDVESEVLLTLYDLIIEFNPDLSYFSFFVSTRIDYKLLKRCREAYLLKNTQGNGITEIMFSDMPDNWSHEWVCEDPLDRNFKRDMIQESVEMLPESLQETITLYYYDQYTQEEAAKILKISQAAFSKRHKKALTLMKKVISTENQE